MKEKLEFEEFLIQAHGVKNAIHDSVIKSGSVKPSALIMGYAIALSEALSAMIASKAIKEGEECGYIEHVFKACEPTGYMVASTVVKENEFV